MFTGIVKMVDSGDILKIDQTHLETVIPAIGNDLSTCICICNGGKIAQIFGVKVWVILLLLYTLCFVLDNQLK